MCLIEAIPLVLLMRVDAQPIDRLVPAYTPDKAEFVLPRPLRLSNAVLHDCIDLSIVEIVG
jgi:hypothetical protein